MVAQLPARVEHARFYCIYRTLRDDRDFFVGQSEVENQHDCDLLCWRQSIQPGLYPILKLYRRAFIRKLRHRVDVPYQALLAPRKTAHGQPISNAKSALTSFTVSNVTSGLQLQARPAHPSI